jgi:Protein of unknown function (DUF2569)
MGFRFLNKNSYISDQRGYAGQPLGGWIIFLGITLIIRVAAQSYYFYLENYFLKTTWTRLELAGGAKLQTLFIAEMFISLLAIASTGALIFWFFGRRDIFPKMFVYSLGLLLAAQLILLMLYYVVSLPFPVETVRKEMWVQFGRMVFYSGIWGAFVMRSENVKQTFVYPPG